MLSLYCFFISRGIVLQILLPLHLIIKTIKIEMEYILLIVSLALIIVGAMILTDGSVALAHRLRVPEFIVGLTVVALGTSMPEFVVSLLSALKGSGEMAIGNVVGSNTFNVFAILIYPAPLKYI